MNYFKKTKSLWLVIGVLGILGVGSLVYSYAGGSPSTVFEGDCVNCTIEGVVAVNETGDMVGGGSGTKYPDGYIDTGEGYYVDGEEIINGDGQLAGTNTTTLNEITLGTKFRDDLIFTAGATTTPGGLFSLQNTGADMVCDAVHLNITTAGGGTSCEMELAVSTSTLATSWSGSGLSIFATSTMATNTALFFNDTDNTGGNAADSWIWPHNEYLLGAFDSPTTGLGTAASSTCYSNMAGNVSILCHTN